MRSAAIPCAVSLSLSQVGTTVSVAASAALAVEVVEVAVVEGPGCTGLTEKECTPFAVIPTLVRYVAFKATGGRDWRRASVANWR